MVLERWETLYQAYLQIKKVFYSNTPSKTWFKKFFPIELEGAKNNAQKWQKVSGNAYCTSPRLVKVVVDAGSDANLYLTRQLQIVFLV